MTWTQAEAIMTRGGRVTRESYIYDSVPAMQAYRVGGELRCDSGELIAMKTWTPSAPEASATDWIEVV